MVYRVLSILLTVILVSCSKNRPIKAVALNQIIPAPTRVTSSDGTLLVTKHIKLHSPSDFDLSHRFLVGFLTANGYTVTDVAPQESQWIFKQDSTLAQEAYALEISDNQLVLRAATDRGLFYGLQS